MYEPMVNYVAYGLIGFVILVITLIPLFFRGEKKYHDKPNKPIWRPGNRHNKGGLN